MTKTPAETALEALLQALSPLRVFGQPVSALNQPLARAIAKAAQALDSDSEQPPAALTPELEASMPFLYALVAPGADANAIVAGNPSCAAAAHRAIYERAPREATYKDMMAGTGAGRHVGSGGMQPPPTAEEYAKAKSLAAEGGSFHPTVVFLQAIVRALRARAPVPAFSLQPGGVPQHPLGAGDYVCRADDGSSPPTLYRVLDVYSGGGALRLQRLSDGQRTTVPHSTDFVRAPHTAVQAELARAAGRSKS